VDHAGHHRRPQGARRDRGRAEGEGVGVVLLWLQQKKKQ
jgi:hypothetical protein